MISADQARQISNENDAELVCLNALLNDANEAVRKTASVGGKRTSINTVKYKDHDVKYLTNQLESLGYLVGQSHEILLVSWEREHVVP